MNPEMLAACRQATEAVYADKDEYVAASSDDEESEPETSKLAGPPMVRAYYFGRV